MYSVKKKTASASAAVSKKFHPVCQGKLVVASPLPINGMGLRSFTFQHNLSRV